MGNSYDNSFQRYKTILKTQNIILLCISWAAMALLYFLLFSAKIPGTDGKPTRPDWYVIGTNIFEAVAYLSASVLCLRNWRSEQIVSNRKVWLSIGLGMFAYFIGGIWFGYNEIVLHDDSDLSYSDIFFVLTYLCLGMGMVLALFSRRINLGIWEWLLVAAIALSGSGLAWWISNSRQQSTTGGLSLVAAVNTFYVVSDVALLIIASTLLLAFWGGKASLSWRMIAAAAFSLYIADMWYKYAQGFSDYKSGDILEVFWVFSGVLFGMGAVLEHEASLGLKRRTSGRKRT
jgi:hypothetical protein